MPSRRDPFALVTVDGLDNAVMLRDPFPRPSRDRVVLWVGWPNRTEKGHDTAHVTHFILAALEFE